MGKREKLIERLTTKPQTATFGDLRNLLEYEGFYLDRITSSHHIFKYDETTLLIPVHSNKVKSIYLEKLLELVEQADLELEDED